MVAFSFKRRFVDPTLAGTKGGTIRADRKDGKLPPLNCALQLYTGMRTTQCELILITQCCGVRRIRLIFKGRTRIVASNIGLTAAMFGKAVHTWRSAEQLDDFARFDGFADFADMRDFWRETHDALAEFEGNWIRWLRPLRRLPMGSTVVVGQK